MEGSKGNGSVATQKGKAAYRVESTVGGKSKWERRTRKRGSINTHASAEEGQTRIRWTKKGGSKSTISNTLRDRAMSIREEQSSDHIGSVLNAEEERREILSDLHGWADDTRKGREDV